MRKRAGDRRARRVRGCAPRRPSNRDAGFSAELADYDPQSTAWNGMASFVALAEGMGFEVVPVSSLEWSDLSDNDILFLVYPLQRVDPGRLAAFVQVGGNVLIADDFGESKEAMSALGLLRAEVTTPQRHPSSRTIICGRRSRPSARRTIRSRPASTRS